MGLTHALADISGLAFDRIFMVTEPDGTFITARQFSTNWYVLPPLPYTTAFI
ncbi:2Fe-2S cluster-containing protein [Salmonella enterica subsp. enterica serovar Heidelberg str. N18453]|nr:2Fe-2S cluster-containing protein [Salmonella enterica subsp. enterica serovar Heidelberg str. N18453]